MNLQNRVVIPVALSSRLLEGAWFEAVHEFTSEGTSRGGIEVTAGMLNDFVLNFESGVVARNLNGMGQQELRINYDHYFDGAKGYKAAGWIKELKLVPKYLRNGKAVTAMFIKPTWTPQAEEAIRSGEYKYFSIEFEREYLDDQTGAEAKNVLVGGALTNDPFVAELEPITLSNLIEMRKAAQKPAEEAEQKQKEEPVMKELLKAIGLADTATEAEALSAFDTLLVGKDKEIEALKKDAEIFKSELQAIKDAKAAEAEAAKAVRKALIIEAAIKEMKFSKAETEDEKNILNILLKKDELDVADLLVKEAPVRFKQEGKSENNADAGTDLSTDEGFAAAMKKLCAEKKMTMQEAYNFLRSEKIKGGR